MNEKEMQIIGNWIADVMDIVKDEQLPNDAKERKPYLDAFRERAHKNPKLVGMRKEVKTMCKKFPIPDSFV